MRRKIYSATRSPETSNIYKMCDGMDWNYPTFKNRTKDGYICKWGGRSLVGHAYHNLIEDGTDKEEAMRLAWESVERDVEDVKKITGIQCRLTRDGNLVVPFGGK